MSGDTSPLDRTVGRTSSSEEKGGADPAGATERDLHETPRSLWLAVGLMCLGAALVGLAVVLFSMNTSAAQASLVAGIVIGLIGAVIGVRKNIMSNVE